MPTTEQAEFQTFIKGTIDFFEREHALIHGLKGIKSIPFLLDEQKITSQNLYNPTEPKRARCRA